MKDLLDWEEMEVFCGYCGHEMQLVRPGKHQCVNEDCPSNDPKQWSYEDGGVAL